MLFTDGLIDSTQPTSRSLSEHDSKYLQKDHLKEEEIRVKDILSDLNAEIQRLQTRRSELEQYLTDLQDQQYDLDESSKYRNLHINTANCKSRNV